MEVTKRIAAQLNNFSAGLESALQEATGVMATTSAGMGLMSSSVGHASLDSMYVLMLNALNDPNVVMAVLTAPTFLMKRTVILMRV